MLSAKTKVLISCAVTSQLICVIVFAYANCWFSHAKVQLEKDLKKVQRLLKVMYLHVQAKMTNTLWAQHIFFKHDNY